MNPLLLFSSVGALQLSTKKSTTNEVIFDSVFDENEETISRTPKRMVLKKPYTNPNQQNQFHKRETKKYISFQRVTAKFSARCNRIVGKKIKFFQIFDRKAIILFEKKQQKQDFLCLTSSADLGRSLHVCPSHTQFLKLRLWIFMSVCQIGQTIVPLFRNLSIILKSCHFDRWSH